jgi:hypothetical protein
VSSDQYFSYIQDSSSSEYCTVKPEYKSHSRESANVAFMSSFPLYTGLNYMHYSLMEKMRLSFIDSDLLYRGAL